MKKCWKFAYFCFGQPDSSPTTRPRITISWPVLAQALSVTPPLVLRLAPTPLPVHLECLSKVKGPTPVPRVGLMHLPFSFSNLLTSLTLLQTLAVIFQNTIRLDILS